MFVDNNEQEYTLLDPGTHRMKVTGWEVKEDGKWTLTFQKGNFKTRAFGNSPFLKEEGNMETWSKVVGPKGGWFVSTKIFFEKIMGKDHLAEALKKAEKLVTVKSVNDDGSKVYFTLEEQWESYERVVKSVKILIECLLEAANPYFSTLWFDVDLEEKVGLDEEGNEKTYLNIAKKTVENGYKDPFRISEDQSEETPVVSEQTPDPQGNAEEVPDWVNERTERKEPADSEW